jgi:hypothetical protein
MIGVRLKMAAEISAFAELSAKTQENPFWG